MGGLHTITWREGSRDEECRKTRQLEQEGNRPSSGSRREAGLQAHVSPVRPVLCFYPTEL